MKVSEIRELSTKEIQEHVDDRKNLLTRLKMNHAISPLDNPLKIRHTRRDIARLKTELQKRLNQESKDQQ